MPGQNSRKKEKTGVSERRDLIMRTAEILFAQKGIDAVSLLEINKAAEQKNTSALYYHFGGKDGLIDAIVYKHHEKIEVKINQQLDKLQACQPYSLRQLTVAFVTPFFEQLEDERGINYLRIVTQLFNKNTDMITIGHPEGADRSRTRALQLYREKYPEMPEQVRISRLLLFSSMLFHSLASYIQYCNPGMVNMHGNKELFFNNLIDCLEGMMKAPVSAETLASI